MVSTASGMRRIVGRALGSVVEVERSEIAGLATAFVYFFSVLCAYYIIRPVRDEMGVAVGPDGLRQLFTIVFLVMLAAVPLYGWVVSRFARRLVVPVIYSFFVACLVAFWGLFEAGVKGPLIAGTFFVWTSVFNLFVVSLFWILMSDLYRTDQAKRLYGFIAAGGSVGALTGPLLTQWLVVRLGPHNLLLLSAMFLVVGVGAALVLRGMFRGVAAGQSEAHPVGDGLLAGAVRVFQDPMLFRIAAWVLLANLVSTLFYLEQSRIVGETLADRTQRVLLFSRIDLAVNVLTLGAQVFLTAKVFERIGVVRGASALPAWAAIGLLMLAVSPSLAVIATVMAVERVLAFSLASPAVKVLYTGVGTEDKYKAQNFIDTVVYRGGDAASGWLFNGLSKGLEMGASAMALVALPIGLVWLGLSWTMANEQAARELRSVTTKE